MELNNAYGHEQYRELQKGLEIKLVELRKYYVVFDKTVARIGG